MSKEWRTKVVPVVTTEPAGEVTRHPAFGVVQVSRPQGHMTLMGSDFRHHSCISITVSEAKQIRTLSHTWTHAGRPLIEFDLSGAQFAHMIASAGVGAGTPCTIRHAGLSDIRPQIEIAEREGEKFSRDLKLSLGKAVSAIHDAIKALDEGGNAKQRKASQQALHQALAALEGSVPFVADSFDEHMHNVTEQAKAGAHAMLMRALAEAGIKRLSIEDQHEEPQP